MVDQLNKEVILEETFKQYSKFGNSSSDGKHITLTNIDKWLKEAKLLDGKKLSTTDTAIAFQKFKSKTIDFKTFVQFIETLAKEHKKDINQCKDKLSACKVPGTSQATKPEKSKFLDRMTDTSKYTGTHKKRFDKQGKGKGKSGREDVTENSGYVQGYKHKDTYGTKK